MKNHDFSCFFRVFFRVFSCFFSLKNMFFRIFSMYFLYQMWWKSLFSLGYDKLLIEINVKRFPRKLISILSYLIGLLVACSSPRYTITYQATHLTLSRHAWNWAIDIISSWILLGWQDLYTENTTPEAKRSLKKRRRWASRAALGSHSTKNLKK